MSHERALARKVAEEAAGGGASAGTLPDAAAPGSAPRAHPQRQAGQLSVAVKREQTPDAAGHGFLGLDDSEPEMIDLSDSSEHPPNFFSSRPASSCCSVILRCLIQPATLAPPPAAACGDCSI